ncbi:putative acetyltransferase [uncultured Mediterranean phage uvMED]|nr:putative acetyltransferase [uncultured Mediterranean phage uvMED]
MRLIKFIPEHAKELVLEGKLSVGTMTPEHNWEHYIQRAADHDSWTIVEHGHIICSGGFIDMWEGVAEVWFIGSDKIQTKVKFVVETTKDIMNKSPYTRIHASVKADWKKAVRFASFLGFKKEGLMKKFGPEGADYLIMGKVK